MFKNNPLIEYKLKNVTIKLKDSLEANTTYTINFGKSIRDVNEGNEAKNFTYTFSTGNSIDSNTLSGKIILAEDGKIDSTLIAILHRNTNDTAIYKTKPRYIAKLKGDGSFTFKNLPDVVTTCLNDGFISSGVKVLGVKSLTKKNLSALDFL